MMYSSSTSVEALPLRPGGSGLQLMTMVVLLWSFKDLKKTLVVGENNWKLALSGSKQNRK